MSFSTNEFEAPDPAVRGAQFFLVDGLNLAYWRGRPPSLRIPVCLTRHLSAQGHRVRCIFDASTRYRIGVPPSEYEQLFEDPSGCFMQVPSGQPADRELLRLARKVGGRIISRDRFRDHRKKYRKLIDEPGRLVSGFVDGNRLNLCMLAISVQLDVEAEAAEFSQSLA